MLKIFKLNESTLFYIFLLLLVFIPLYPKLPLLEVKGSFVAIRLEDIIIAICYFLFGIYLIVTGKIKEFFFDKVNQIILLYFFVGFVSTFSAIFLTQTVDLKLSILHFFRRIEFMLLLPLALFSLTNIKQIRLSLIILLVLTFVINLYALGQQYLHFPVVSTLTSELSKGQITYVNEWTRINSTFAGHYDLAIFLVIMMTITSSLFFYHRSLHYKIAQVLMLGLSSYVLVLTASRLSFLAAILGILAVLILAGKKLYIGLLMLIIIMMLIYPSNLRERLVSTIIVFNSSEVDKYNNPTKIQEEKSRLNIPTLPQNIEDLKELTSSARPYAEQAPDLVPGEPIDNTQRGVLRSFSIRLNVEWPRAIRALIKNPLLGSGYSSIGIATDNGYLRSLGETGILGTLSFSLIFVYFFKVLWKYYKSGSRFLRYFSIGSITMIFTVLLNALVFDVLEASKIAAMFWMMIGINLAAGKIIEGDN